MKKTKRTDKIESLYVDQAMVSNQYFDRRVCSTFTLWGIRQMDSMFIKKIMNMPTKKYADNLRREIKQNPHLHSKIKENLLENLKNYRKKIGPQSLARWKAIEDATPYEGKTVRILSGRNRGIIGTVIWYDAGEIGSPRIGVKSNDLNFWGSLYDKNVGYFSDTEVEVILV